MIDPTNYAKKAEDAIYSREEERTANNSLIWVKNLQYDFEKEGFGFLPEHQAILLDCKRDKIPSINADLELLQFEIKRIENNLLELLTKRKELQIKLVEAKEDLSDYEQKLKANNEDEALEAQAEMEWERAMSGY